VIIEDVPIRHVLLRIADLEISILNVPALAVLSEVQAGKSQEELFSLAL
jgi:hypothetical protein